MRKLLNKLFFILLILVTNSCCTNRKNNVNNSFRDYYKSYSSIFNDSLLSHFPREVDSLFDFYHCRSITDKHKDKLLKRNSLILMQLVSNRTIDSIEKIVIKSEQTIKANDSCALIINELNNEKSNPKSEFERVVSIRENDNLEEEIDSALFDLLNYRKQNCDKLSFPIPNFSPLDFYNYKITNGNRLSNDFTLYVIDAKKGQYMPEEYLTIGLGMPDEWKNGFSRGIAISKKQNIIVYWLEVW